MYKICHGIVDIDQNCYLRPHTNCGAKTRVSHDYKFLNVSATKDFLFLFLFPTHPEDVEQTTERHC